VAEEQRTTTNTNEVLLDAFAAARGTHADFDALEPIMLECAKALFPDFRLITPAEYVEALYAIAKYADCVPAEVRQSVLANAMLETRPVNRSVM
jgi:hypothetical protein